MNWLLAIVIPLAVIGFILLIITMHDTSVTMDKTNKIFQSIRANETCAELKESMAFTDKENQGMWLKSPYDSDVIKYYKEKNCS